MGFVDTIRKTFLLNTLHPTQIDNSPLTFAKSRKAMLKQLELSKEHGLLTGVYSKAFGEGMFLVGISDIHHDGPLQIIVFETYDQSGMLLNRTSLSIDEIRMVCPFNKKYINPVLNKLQIA